jgi:hypothetical protein
MSNKRSKAPAAAKPAVKTAKSSTRKASPAAEKPATSARKTPTAPRKPASSPARPNTAALVKGAYTRTVEGGSDTMIETSPGRFINAVSAQKLGFAKGD